MAQRYFKIYDIIYKWVNFKQIFLPDWRLAYRFFGGSAGQKLKLELELCLRGPLSYSLLILMWDLKFKYRRSCTFTFRVTNSIKIYLQITNSWTQLHKWKNALSIKQVQNNLAIKIPSRKVVCHFRSHSHSIHLRKFIQIYPLVPRHCCNGLPYHFLHCHPC